MAACSWGNGAENDLTPPIAYRWDVAELRRMQRTPEQARRLRLRCWLRRCLWWSAAVARR